MKGMMSEQDCTGTHINDLQVSESCHIGLRNVGFTTVGEIVEFFANVIGQGGSVDPDPSFLMVIDETIAALKAMGCWPEGLDE
jgi:hypothetical protein